MFVMLASPISFPLSAAEHPSFTGSWKLDKTNSDFGALPAPNDLADIIDQQPAEILVHRTRDGRDMEVHVPLDGSEKQNNIMGAALKTTAHWDGDALMVSSIGTMRGNAVTFQEKWTMAADGKTFTVARHLTGARGETDQTVIMLRQAGLNAALPNP